MSIERRVNEQREKPIVISADTAPRIPGDSLTQEAIVYSQRKKYSILCSGVYDEDTLGSEYQMQAPAVISGALRQKLEEDGADLSKNRLETIFFDIETDLDLVPQLSPHEGTSVLAVQITQDSKRLFVGNVGNSSAFVLKDGKLTSLTYDERIMGEGYSKEQTLYIRRLIDSFNSQEDIDSLDSRLREEVPIQYFFNNRNRPTRDIRARMYAKPFIEKYPLEEVTKIILASSGVTSNLTRKEIEHIVNSDEQYQAAEIIEQAKNRIFTLNETKSTPHFRAVKSSLSAIVIDL